MKLLLTPEPEVVHAFGALRGDRDFQKIVGWLEHSVQELDKANRVQMDGAILRMQQGAASALTELIDRVNDQHVRAVKLA